MVIPTLPLETAVDVCLHAAVMCWVPRRWPNGQTHPGEIDEERLAEIKAALISFVEELLQPDEIKVMGK